MNARSFKWVTIAGFLVLMTCAFLSGCSKKDSAPDPDTTEGDISAAVGSFKGKLTLYAPGNGPSTDYFDAVINVTKAGDGKLLVSAKAGEAYSGATSKTFNVTYMGAGTDIAYITDKEGSLEGTFLYKVDLKTLQMLTEVQQADDTMFAFEGTKQ